MHFCETMATLTSVFCFRQAEESNWEHDASIILFEYTKSVGRTSATWKVSYRTNGVFVGTQDLTPLLTSRLKTCLNHMDEQTFDVVMQRMTYSVRAPAQNRAFLFVDLKTIIDGDKYGLLYISVLRGIVMSNKKIENKCELFDQFGGLSQEICEKVWAKPLFKIANKLPQAPLTDLAELDAIFVRDYTTIGILLFKHGLTSDPLMAFICSLKKGLACVDGGTGMIISATYPKDLPDKKPVVVTKESNRRPCFVNPTGKEEKECHNKMVKDYLAKHNKGPAPEKPAPKETTIRNLSHTTTPCSCVPAPKKPAPKEPVPTPSSCNCVPAGGKGKEKEEKEDELVDYDLVREFSQLSFVARNLMRTPKNELAYGARTALLSEYTRMCVKIMGDVLEKTKEHGDNAAPFLIKYMIPFRAMANELTECVGDDYLAKHDQSLGELCFDDIMLKYMSKQK